MAKSIYPKRHYKGTPILKKNFWKVPAWGNGVAILRTVILESFSKFGTDWEIGVDLCMHTKRISTSLVCEA